ncbi:unnamed protein product [Adineta steineri]|uniref:Uncharacterized protein n=1 Tax=Adineta steineri TaxID=433720 RepID=A0A814AX18_9BILA|nr:unnamed protein product [Adineta steineri]
MKSYQVLFLISYSLINFLTLCYGSADVYTDGMYIKDESDRIRIYHGTNFVNKGFPWYPPELLDPTFVANLSSWGLNFVRIINLPIYYFFRFYLRLFSIAMTHHLTF